MLHHKLRRFRILLTLIIASPLSVSAAEYKPAIEFASLLDMRFYEENASFMVDGLQLVFPQAGLDEIGFVIVDENNKVAGSSKLRTEKWEDFPAFDGLRAVGPGFVKLEKPGKYTMAFRTASGQFLTTYSFTLNLHESGDATNPVRRWYRDGYWPNLAYLSAPVDAPDEPMKFTWWTSRREVEGGKKSAKCTVHLIKDGTEIAHSGSPVIISYNNWNSFTTNLVQTKETGGNRFTPSMLTSEDGEYSLVMKIDDKAVKSYALKVSKGEIERLKFNKLGYEPPHGFISPRKIDTPRSGNYEMLDLWWVLRK
jgi:hypothetical protein